MSKKKIRRLSVQSPSHLDVWDSPSLDKGAKFRSTNEPTSLEENVAKVIFYVERKLKIGASDPNSWFSAVTVVAVVCSGS